MKYKTANYLLLLVIFILLYYLSYNYQDILAPAYLISGDIKNFGSSFDYHVHSQMLTLLPISLYPLVYLGFSVSVISKFVTAFFSMLYLLGITYFFRPYEKNTLIRTFLGVSFLAATYFSIPTLYSFDIIRTASTGGFVGTILASVSLLYTQNRGRFPYYLSLITFLLHPVLGIYSLIILFLTELFCCHKNATALLNKFFICCLTIPLFFGLKFTFSILLPLESLKSGEGLYTDIVKNWDIHRVFVSYYSSEFIAVLISFIFSLFKIMNKKKNMSKNIALIFTTSSFYIFSTLAYNHFSGYLPGSFTSMMPQRFSLFPIFLITLYILSEIHKKYGRGATFFSLLIPILLNIVAYLGLINFELLSYLKVIYILICLFTLRINISFKKRNISWIIIGLCLLMSTIFYKLKYRVFILPEQVTEEVKLDGNVLSCSSCYSVAVLYKFSNLINLNEVDTISYIPGVSLYFSSVFKDIYEVNYDEVNVGKGYQFYIDQSYEQRLWESRKKKQWKELSVKYKIKGILVPAHWRLNLPSKDLGNFKLYLL